MEAVAKGCSHRKNIFADHKNAESRVVLVFVSGDIVANEVNADTRQLGL